MAKPELVQRLRENVGRVREVIGEACGRVGRDPRSVGLVAVTKYVDLPVIEGLLAAGVREIGENRVQQLAARAEALGSRLEEWRDPGQLTDQGSAAAAPAAPSWHMIGHLQRNKVKALLPHTRVIHSLDSTRLAAEIQKVAERLDVQVDAFLEVNVSGEASKQGVSPDELAVLAEAVREQSRVRLRGLMTMAPFDPDAERARPCFARLREVLERLRDSGAVGRACVHLSMGMSQDYGVAVEEGATFVRVGSALYEDLPPEYAPAYG
jgi:pyridoxal phosphate enzyme (YggS family)